MRLTHGLLVISLATFGLVTTPAQADTATARGGGPRMVTVNRTGTWDLNGPIPYDYDKPILKSAPKEARAEFAHQVRRLIRLERSALKEWHSGDCAQYDGQFNGRPEVGIYRNRYASVVMRFSTTGCGGVSDQHPRGFTLDLSTLKTVGADRFTTNAQHARDWSIFAAMLRKYQGGCSVSALGSEKSAPGWSAWRVSSAGFTAYYRRYALAEGACGDMYATIGWNHVARPRDANGKHRNGYYLFYSDGCQYMGGSPCGFLKVIARGSVVRYDGGVTGDFGWVGLRSGKKGTFATTGSGGGQFETLRFASKDKTVKPKNLGSEWRRVSKAEYERHY